MVADRTIEASAEDGRLVPTDLLLEVRVASKLFQLESKSIPVHSDLAFDISEGQFWSLLGPSGCGKSTLLRMIAGLDLDFAGAIRLRGELIDSPGSDRGVVFQQPNLLPWYTAAQNIEFALPKETDNRRERVNEALNMIGMSEFGGAFPSQLSGGMAKRVALARALVNRPSILLLDEPFGALDFETRFQLYDELRAIHQERGMTTLLVTHDVEEAVYLSDHIAVLTPRPMTVREVLKIELPSLRQRASSAFTQELKRVHQAWTKITIADG